MVEDELILVVGVKRVFDVHLLAITVLIQDLEFVPLRVGKFLLHLYIMVVLHDEDEVSLEQEFFGRAHRQRRQ